MVLVLVPFAGIAFLWFTGVMRDLMGALEDKFFSTVFLGSGIILVVMMYVNYRRRKGLAGEDRQTVAP